MNDPTAPPAIEWFMRMSAVIGMVILFVLAMKLMMKISSPSPSAMEQPSIHGGLSVR